MSPSVDAKNDQLENLGEGTNWSKLAKKRFACQNKTGARVGCHETQLDGDLYDTSTPCFTPHDKLNTKYKGGMSKKNAAGCQHSNRTQRLIRK